MEQTTGSCTLTLTLKPWSRPPVAAAQLAVWYLTRRWELTDDQPTAKVAFELKNMKDVFMAFQVSLPTCTACGGLTVDCEQLW